MPPWSIRAQAMASVFRSLPFVSIPSIRLCNSVASRWPLRRRIPGPPRRRFSATSVCSSSSPELVVPDPKVQTIDQNGLEWVSRTHLCGGLTVNDVGKKVRLCGWVALHRIHGSLTFLNLRDHSGIVQVTTLPDEFPDAHWVVNKLRLEYVVAVEGVVRSRPSESINQKMKTGFVEVTAEHVRILNSVKSSLPITVTTSDDAKEVATEEVRLRYRYLDLRRQQMHSNLTLRHNVVKVIRRYLEDVHDFVEVETPILSRSTPEGARDYLVPSRLQEPFMLYLKVPSCSSKCSWFLDLTNITKLQGVP